MNLINGKIYRGGNSGCYEVVTKCTLYVTKESVAKNATGDEITTKTSRI